MADIREEARTYYCSLFISAWWFNHCLCTRTQCPLSRKATIWLRHRFGELHRPVNYFCNISDNFVILQICIYYITLQAMHGAPLYIAETCPSQIRGTLVSLKELFIVLGILVSYDHLIFIVFSRDLTILETELFV